MIEFEKTYLAKYLPENLNKCESKEIIDIYLPKDAEHPKLRIRKSADKYEITKKQPVKNGDASEQIEQTIVINEKEFNALSELKGKRIRKNRYFFPFNGRIAEIDVFEDNLKGLVTVEFEFERKKEKAKFERPDFCLADVTQEDFIAGGRLCGKKYKDIEEDLKKFGYRKI
jgi:CYTH domain-containing protein